MPVFYSPEGNAEVWDEKPDARYQTEEEWFAAHPEEERPRDFDPDEWRAVRFAELDRKSVRPLRAIAAGAATDEDLARLRDLETQAARLRAEAAAAAGEGEA